MTADSSSTDYALAAASSLHSAAANGDASLVQYALESGRSPNAILQGVSPIHAAASCGDVASVKLLLSYGADVDTPRLQSTLTGPGAPGSRPLHFAAANGHADVVRLLLSHGARPAAVDADGVSPETLAIANGHRHCIDIIRTWVHTYGQEGLAAVGPGTSSSPQSAASPLRSQTSLEQLTSNVKATLKHAAAMGRTSSNPNLRARAPPPLPSPTLKPPEDEEDDSDLGFSTATTPVNAKVSSAMSKRRPSMPSILEKAAHPGQTIRSALSATTQDDGTGAASGVPPAAKGFKSGGSLAAKRSISNFFLRKATTQQAQSSHGGELAAPTLSAGGVSSKSARGLSLASTFSPRKSAGAIKPSPASTSTSVADPRNVTMATSHHRAPPAPPSPSAKSLSSSSPPSRPRRRAQSLVGALQRRPFASDPAPPLPGAPLSPTSSLSSNGGGGSGGSSALGQVQTSFRDIVWQTSSSSGGTNSGSNSAVAVAPAAACDEEREYLGESSPTHDGQDDDDGGMGDSFLPASLRRREGSTTGPGSSSGGSRNSPRGFRLVKLPSTGTLNSVVLAEGNSPAGGRSRSGTTSNASNSTGSIRSVVGQGTSPRAEMNRQRSSSSLSSMASTPASAAGKASAQLRRPPAETSRNRSNSLASASFLSTSSNSSLRAAFNSASGPPPSSEQARNLLLKHAGEFGAGRGVVGEDGNTLTLAKQLAAYGEALERERGGSSAAGGPGSGLTYKRSREALPSVKEYGRPPAPTERGLVAPAPPSGSAVTRYRSSSDTASTSAAGVRIYGRQSFASSSNAPAVDSRTSSSAGRGHKQRSHPQQRPIPPDLDRSANSSPNRERSASDSGLLHPPARRGDPVYANTSPSGRPASNSASTGGTDATGVSGSTAPTSVGGYEEVRPKMSHVCGADDEGEQEERLQDDGEDSWERVG